VSSRYLRQRFDAIVLTMGAGAPRDLDVPGRGFENVHFAMEYLTQQNKLLSGEPLEPGEKHINAKDKVVVVIGGGDTGSDCIGTANRQGAREVHQFEILPKPPEQRPDETPWPFWPRQLRTSSSQEEGCQRRWAVNTKRLHGADNRVTQLEGIEVQWQEVDGRWKMSEKPGTEFTMDVDLVLLAMGFVHVVHEGLVTELGVELDGRGNIKRSGEFMTNEEGIFVAGDTWEGASLVVRAIDDGRRCAAATDNWLRSRQ
jgi:glutamate synthase (NADPH/NADH) small chain